MVEISMFNVMVKLQFYQGICVWRLKAALFCCRSQTCVGQSSRTRLPGNLSIHRKRTHCRFWGGGGVRFDGQISKN